MNEGNKRNARKQKLIELIRSNTESNIDGELAEEQLKALSDYYLSITPDISYDSICELLSYMRMDFNKIINQALKSIKRNIHGTNLECTKTFFSNIRKNIGELKLKKKDINEGKTIVGTSIIKTMKKRKDIGKLFALMQIQLALLSMNGITVEPDEENEKWIVKQNEKRIVSVYGENYNKKAYDFSYLQTAIGIARQKYFIDRDPNRKFRMEFIINNHNNVYIDTERYEPVFENEGEEYKRLKAKGRGDNR